MDGNVLPFSAFGFEFVHVAAGVDGHSAPVCCILVAY
jgi:hypothetical protein